MKPIEIVIILVLIVLLYFTAYLSIQRQKQEVRGLPQCESTEMCPIEVKP